MTRPLVAAAAALLLVGYSAQTRAQEPATPVESPFGTTGPKEESTTTSVQAHAAELRKKLTAEQYRVTCEAATEPAFQNAYWNNHKPGIYVNVISGQPLFSSLDKFDSGTGWPSFTKPLVKESVTVKSDTSLGEERTEVVAKDNEAHLGHVFDDGPSEAGGKRYCINSASLKFIPVEKLKEAGYAEYLPLFEKAVPKEKK